MIAVSYLLLAYVTAHLIMIWKALEERSAKWRLYALRDQLRLTAIEEPGLLDSALFARVDCGLTGLAANLHDVSLWYLLPIMLHEKDTPEFLAAERRVAELSARPENAPIAAIAAQATEVFAAHLFRRHLILALAAIGASVGYGACQTFIARISRGVVTHLIEPPLPAVAGGRPWPQRI